MPYIFLIWHIIVMIYVATMQRIRIYLVIPIPYIKGNISTVDFDRKDHNLKDQMQN